MMAQATENCLKQEMIEVEFLVDREVTDGAGKVIARFKAGKVYELSNASAHRWISRHAAKLVRGTLRPVGPRGPQSESERRAFGKGKEKPALDVDVPAEAPVVSSPPTKRPSRWARIARACWPGRGAA